MGEKIISTIITVAVSTSFGALLTWVVAIRNTNKKLSDAVCSLLRADIIRQSEKYSERGWMPIYAKEALSKEYTAYHGLGGNDVATQLYKDMMCLPCSENEKESKHGTD